jgi:hypothetical protein
MSNHTAVPAEFSKNSVPATENQISYMRALIAKRVLSDVHTEWVDRHIEEGMTKTRASEIIEHLCKLPLKVEVTHQQDQQLIVLNGHYAIRTPEDTINPIKFYTVKSPTGGRWAGYCFVERHSSDERLPIRSKAQKREVLEAIRADALAATKLYGQEVGCCGRCGRQLTTEESRQFGIGPDCRAKMGL